AELHVLGADVLGPPVPVVVRVVLLAGNQGSPQAPEVLEEAGLELIHADDAGRVRRVDTGDAVADAAFSYALVDLFRDVADLEPAPCPQSALLLKDLHVALPPPPSRGSNKIRRTVFLVTLGPYVQVQPAIHPAIPLTRQGP